MANKKSKAGLLNNSAASARTAYGMIVPLVAAILHGQRLTVQQVQTLEAYVNPQGGNQAPQITTQQPKANSVTNESPLEAGGPKNNR